MKESPKSKGNTTPRDKKIYSNSMEIPPKPRPTSSTSTPPASKPSKTK